MIFPTSHVSVHSRPQNPSEMFPQEEALSQHAQALCI